MYKSYISYIYGCMIMLYIMQGVYKILIPHISETIHLTFLIGISMGYPLEEGSNSIFLKE